MRSLLEQNSLLDTDIEHIHKTYYSVLCRFARRILKQNEDAEDIVSNIFLTLCESHDSKHIKKSLKSFLFQGVRNNSFKFLQHKKVMYKYCDHVRHSYTNSDWLLIYDKENNVSVMISQNLETKINNAINELPEKSREVFVLVMIEELKYKDVADRLGITIGTVKKQVNRAITKLQNQLKDFDI